MSGAEYSVLDSQRIALQIPTIFGKKIPCSSICSPSAEAEMCCKSLHTRHTVFTGCLFQIELHLLKLWKYAAHAEEITRANKLEPYSLRA